MSSSFELPLNIADINGLVDAIVDRGTQRGHVELWDIRGGGLFAFFLQYSYNSMLKILEVL